MTFRTESRITVASSVDEVWAYMCDVRRWQEWAPTVIECHVRGGAPFQVGAQLDQRAKWILGIRHGRSQGVTLVEAPHYMAFAGPMGTSAARWGMELQPIDDRHTDTMMWVEVDLAGIMRAIPGGSLKRRVQRVSNLEMVLIKSAIESDALERTP
jgi:polyketide cyclase/dehydrase/lipid transport protein